MIVKIFEIGCGRMREGRREWYSRRQMLDRKDIQGVREGKI